MNEAEKAEVIQSLKAYLIPSSMFVACLLNAAGIYILYAGNSVGVVFLAAGFGIIISALFAFVTFQNKHRARGDSPALQNDDDFDFDEHPELESPEERERQLTR